VHQTGAGQDAPLGISGNWIKESDIGFEMNEPDRSRSKKRYALKEKHGGRSDCAFNGPGAREADDEGSTGKGADRGIHIRRR